MRIADSDRLLNAARSVILAEKQPMPQDTLVDQMAARLLLLSDRIRELERVVDEVALQR